MSESMLSLLAAARFVVVPTQFQLWFADRVLFAWTMAAPSMSL
jgi:hypothetical protein